MWKKNFRIRKLQTVILFLILFLCSALINSSINLLFSLDKPMTDLAAQCNAPDALFYPNDRSMENSKQLATELETLSGITKVELVECQPAYSNLYFQGELREGFSSLVKYNENVYKDVRVCKGASCELSDLKNENSTNCYVPLCLANQYKMKIGDEIEIAVGGDRVSYQIAGFYADISSSSTAFDNYILTASLPTQGETQGRLCVYTDEAHTIQEIENEYRRNHDGITAGSFGSKDEKISQQNIAGNILGAICLAIGIVMLFVSALIINFVVRNNLRQDAKNIAMYKTMGYATKDIYEIYMYFYFAITATSTFCGIVASKFATNAILKNMFLSIDANPEVNILTFGVPTFWGINLFVLMIIWLVLHKTKSVKPIYALNGLENSNTKKSYHGNSKTQFSPFGIALRNIIRNKKGIIGVVITSIATIFSINFAIISLDMAKNMKNQNDYWLGVDKSDVIFMPNGEKEIDSLEKKLEADSRIEYFTSANMGDTIVTLPWEEGQEFNVLYTTVYEDYSKVTLPVISGRNPKASNEIAITTKAASVLKKEIGDYITIHLNENTSTNLLITGLFQSYINMGKNCRLCKETYTQNQIYIPYDHYSVYLKDQVSVEEYLKEAKQEYASDATVINRTEMYSNIMDMIMEPQLNVIPPLILVVCIIGGINIFCIVMLKNKESEKQLGIYKTIGFTSKHLLCANIVYVLMIAFVCVLVALPLNLVSYQKIMITALGFFGFRSYPTRFDLSHLILCNIIILITFIIATTISSHSIKKIAVRDLASE